MRVSAVVIVFSTLLFGSAAQAMTIVQYDKMADDERNEYVADLVLGAQKVLDDAGQHDVAIKVGKLFTEIKPGDKISAGMAEFAVLLANARLADERRIEKDSHARPLEVEDAMALTLQKNGIELPDSFFTVATRFQPPMITKNPDGTFTVQKIRPKGSKDSNRGLVIPPQIVVPFILPPTVEKKHDATSLR